MYNKVTRDPLQAQRQKKKSPRRRFEDGQRRAATRAFTAAAMWLGLPLRPPTQADAAEMTGSNTSYVVAAAALLQSGDAALIAEVQEGRVPMIEAAKSVRKKLDLVRAFGRASEEDRRALGLAVGPDRVFDEVVLPALNR